MSASGRSEAKRSAFGDATVLMTQFCHKVHETVLRLAHSCLTGGTCPDQDIAWMMPQMTAPISDQSPMVAEAAISQPRARLTPRVAGVMAVVVKRSASKPANAESEMTRSLM